MQKYYILILLISGCGKAHSGYLHAQPIPSLDGAVCYAIIDDSGNVKGGNCK